MVKPGIGRHSPVLEPNLYRPFGHVNVLRYSFTDNGSRGRVFIELDLECHKLILSSPLPLLVLLLLGEGTLSWWPTRVREVVDQTVGG